MAKHRSQLFLAVRKLALGAIATATSLFIRPTELCFIKAARKIFSDAG
jgi:hypothetical protein